jgi:uncharacterized protein DUF4186
MTNDKKELIDQRLEVLKHRPFQAKFRLQSKERAIVEQRGLGIVRRHATDLLAKRLFIASPAKDGKQTPYRGHPVFVAQHATATCCRTCLSNWHKLPKGREITLAEQEYVLDVIETWIKREI